MLRSSILRGAAAAFGIFLAATGGQGCALGSATGTDGFVQRDAGEGNGEERGADDTSTTPARRPREGGPAERTPPPTEQDPDGGLPPGDAGTGPIACTSDGGAAANVQLAAIGQVYNHTLNFAGAPTAEPFSSSGVCPLSDSPTTSTGPRPQLAVIVQNTSGRDATLSAWAVCGSQADVFMAFYRNRTSVPTTAAERRECATGTIMSNGFSLVTGTAAKEYKDHQSPDSNGAQFCPALKREENTGLFLRPCETVLVLLHSFYDEAARPGSLPTAVRFRLD